MDMEADTEPQPQHGVAILVKWHLINLKHFGDTWICFP